MVGNILKDLRHQHQSTLDFGWRLSLDDSHFTRGDNCWVDESEEQDCANGSKIVLDALRKSFAENLNIRNS